MAIIVKGKLVATDTPAGLCARCQEDMRLELTVSSCAEALASALGQHPEVTSLSRAEDTLRLEVRSLDAALSAVSAVTKQLGTKLEAIRTVRPSLEDAFVQLTGLDMETLQSGKPRHSGGGGR